MKATDAIASLDRQLIENGARVGVRRYTAASGDPRPKIEVLDVPAFVRGVEPAQFVGPIDQGSSNVTMSPTLLSALLPLKKGDKVIINGRERNVEVCEPISIQTIVVRINLVVLG